MGEQSAAEICHGRRRHAARSPVNTRLICRGVHKKFMAGNQEPVPRRVIRSTGGRSRGWIPKRGGCAPTLTARGKLRARVVALYVHIYVCIYIYIYIYIHTRTYVFVSFRAIFFRFARAAGTPGLKIKFRRGERPRAAFHAKGPNLRSLQISRGFYAKVEIKDGS